METGKNLLNFNLIILGGLQLEYVDGSGFVLRQKNDKQADEVRDQ